MVFRIGDTVRIIGGFGEGYDCIVKRVWHGENGATYANVCIPTLDQELVKDILNLQLTVPDYLLMDVGL